MSHMKYNFHYDKDLTPYRRRIRLNIPLENTHKHINVHSPMYTVQVSGIHYILAGGLNCMCLCHPWYTGRVASIQQEGQKVKI